MHHANDKFSDEIASIFNPIVEKITTLIETEMRSASTYLSKDVSVSKMPAKLGLSDVR